MKKFGLLCVMIGLLFTTACGQKKNTNSGDNNQNSENDSEEVIEKQLQLSDEVVSSLVEKVNFRTNVLTNLYEENDFENKTISNELVLTMGFNDIEVKCDLRGSDPYPTETVSADLVDSNIKKIFGNDISYTKQKFNPASGGLYGYDFYYSVDIDYNNNSYIVSCPSKSSPNPEMANQEFYKATMKGSEITLYSYLKFSRDIKNSGDCIYKDYDMNKANDRFYNVVACYDDSLNEVKQGENEYITLAYTFDKDANGNYILKSFQKINK